MGKSRWETHSVYGGRERYIEDLLRLNGDALSSPKWIERKTEKMEPVSSNKFARIILALSPDNGGLFEDVGIGPTVLATVVLERHGSVRGGLVLYTSRILRMLKRTRT